jgi:hypothetical protein
MVRNSYLSRVSEAVFSYRSKLTLALAEPAGESEMFQSAGDALDSFPALARGIDSIVAALKSDIQAASVQWASLKRIGGARDDHAASLKQSTKVRVGSLRDHLDRVYSQLHNLVCDPFNPS